MKAPEAKQFAKNLTDLRGRDEIASNAGAGGIIAELRVMQAGIHIGRDGQWPARLDQRLRALEAGIANGRGSRYAQAAPLILGGVRVELRLFHILDGEEANALAGFIGNDQPLDPVLVEELARFLDRRIHGHRNHFARHELGDLAARIIDEACVAIGDDADDRAVRLNHGNAGKAGPLLDVVQLLEARRRRDGDRVHHHAAFIFLHLRNLPGLFVDREVAVNDADAARLRHCNGKARFRHRVHGRAEDWDIQFNGGCQPG